MQEQNKIKYLDINEFREIGLLQEVNRQFFHPLGLALEIRFDEDGSASLGGIWDYRDDPEGIYYGDNVVNTQRYKDNIKRVAEMCNAKSFARVQMFGIVQQ